MTQTEFWVTYLLASRAHLKDAPTTQLVDLEFQNHKLVDLEDVLDHGTHRLRLVFVWDTLTDAAHPTVFRQGFVEAKYRSASWWVTKEGVKVKTGASIEEMLQQGVGRCPETSLRLFVRELYLQPLASRSS